MEDTALYSVCIITGSRAEYGLLEKLIDKCNSRFLTHLVVTGSHLSPQYGMTIDYIKHPISETVDVVLSSSTPAAIAKAMGLTIISFGDVFKRLRPDLLIVLGDRWEIFSACSAAHVAGIPIAHIHGGELTFGSYDDAFRHSITHMASIHFPAADEYANRLHRLGQWPESVFCVGALGCDGLTKKNCDRSGFIVCLYPEPGYDSSLLYHLEQTCKHFLSTNETVFFLGGSADVGSSPAAVKSLRRNEFIDKLSFVRAIIGNSSAGILEAPALGTPTINIGYRQKGRLMADSIIQAETETSIDDAFDILHSDDFQRMMRGDYYIPYKGDNVAQKIVDIIEHEMPIKVKRGFYEGSNCACNRCDWKPRAKNC